MQSWLEAQVQRACHIEVSLSGPRKTSNEEHLPKEVAGKKKIEESRVWISHTAACWSWFFYSLQIFMTGKDLG